MSERAGSAELEALRAELIAAKLAGSSHGAPEGGSYWFRSNEQAAERALAVLRWHLGSQTGGELTHSGLRAHLCPECGRIASVPEDCKRPICVHSWMDNGPEIWDGDDVDGTGRTIEQSSNEHYRVPGPHTWAEMKPVELIAREVEQ